jgi:hypothetical protein
VTQPYDNSASSLFPAVVPRGGEVPELQRSAGAFAKWADRQVTWSKHTHIRLSEAETNAKQALELVEDLAREFRLDLADRKEEREKERAERTRTLSRMAGAFGALIAIMNLATALYFSYRADARERERDARDLAAAVERARSHSRGAP